MLQKSLLKHKIASIPEAIPFIKNQYNVTDEIAEKRLIHFGNQLQISKLSHCRVENRN